jgi:hexosaminidase
MKPSDLSSLPPYVINGEVYGPAYDKAFHQRGIKQMIFTSAVGEERMFPDYSVLPQNDRLHAGPPGLPKVGDIMNKISFDSSRVNTDVIGEVDAGWADEGLNPETFWLGYIAGVAAGWHPGSPSPSELSSTFYSLFYGDNVVNMSQVYRMMSDQAQSWTDSWDRTDSTARKPIWGWSYGIYKAPHPAHDQTMPLPPAPDGNLDYSSTWSKDNARRLALALQSQRENQILMGLLNENMQRSLFNRYNLQVYLTIANLYRQNLTMIAGIDEMDEDLASASQLKDKDPQAALDRVDDALDVAGSIWRERNEVLKNATATWNERWFPRVEDANGRHFLHELDDVKDHLPDRTVDMTYLVYREKILPFGQWVNAIADARNQFAAAHNLPARNYHFDWQDFSEVPGVCSNGAGRGSGASCSY